MISEPPGRQEHLAFQALGDLLVEAILREHVPAVLGLPAAHPLLQVRRDVGDVGLDRVIGVVLPTVAGDDQLGEVLGEQVTDDAYGQIRLAVEQLRGLAGRDLPLDVRPLRLQPVDVADQFFLAGPLGRGADDDTGGLADQLGQDVLEPLALDIGQLAGDPGQVAAGRVDDVAAGNRHVVGQPGALGSDRILRNLDQDGLARLQDLLDLAILTLGAEGVPVDLAGVEHGVPAAADVDEGRLHGRQHVLHPAEVDVADQRRGGVPVHVVLDQDVVLDHRDLGQIVALPDDHLAGDRFAPGQELSLAQDRRPAAAGVPALPAALPLGLHPGRALDPGDLVAAALAGTPRLADPDDHVGRFVRRGPGVLARGDDDADDGGVDHRPHLRSRRVTLGRLVLGGCGRLIGGLSEQVGDRRLDRSVDLGLGLVVAAGLVVGSPATAATATPATTATAAVAFGIGVLGLVLGVGRLGLVGFGLGWPRARPASASGHPGRASARAVVVAGVGLGRGSAQRRRRTRRRTRLGPDAVSSRLRLDGLRLAIGSGSTAISGSTIAASAMTSSTEASAAGATFFAARLRGARAGGAWSGIGRLRPSWPPSCGPVVSRRPSWPVARPEPRSGRRRRLRQRLGDRGSAAARRPHRGARWAARRPPRPAVRPGGWPPGAGGAAGGILGGGWLFCVGLVFEHLDSSMAHTRSCSFRAPASGPGCGSYGYRCTEAGSPAVKPGLRHTRKLLVAVERSDTSVIGAGRTSRPSHAQYPTRHTRTQVSDRVRRPIRSPDPACPGSAGSARAPRAGRTRGHTRVIPVSTSSGRTRGTPWASVMVRPDRPTSRLTTAPRASNSRTPFLVIRDTSTSGSARKRLTAAC